MKEKHCPAFFALCPKISLTDDVKNSLKVEILSLNFCLSAVELLCK